MTKNSPNKAEPEEELEGYTLGQQRILSVLKMMAWLTSVMAVVHIMRGAQGGNRNEML